MWWTPSSKPTSKPQTEAPAGSSWRDATPLTGQPQLHFPCLLPVYLPEPLSPAHLFPVTCPNILPLACQPTQWPVCWVLTKFSLIIPLFGLFLCLGSCRRTAWPCQPPTLRPGLPLLIIPPQDHYPSASQGSGNSPGWGYQLNTRR